MKKAAAILLLFWSLVMVQPAFAWFGGKSAYGECSKQIPGKRSCDRKKNTNSSFSEKTSPKSVCGKNKCNKPVNSSSDDDNCKRQGCNPTLGCSSGNFYVSHLYQLSLLHWFTQKQKTFVTDDNRICENMSECFHPPELIP